MSDEFRIHSLSNLTEEELEEAQEELEILIRAELEWREECAEEERQAKEKESEDE